MKIQQFCICSNELLRVNFDTIVVCVLWKNESNQESSFGKISHINIQIELYFTHVSK
jgi:hypothetical protein